MDQGLGKPVEYIHKNCAKTFQPVVVCSECGEGLHAKQVKPHFTPVYYQVHPSTAEFKTSLNQCCINQQQFVYKQLAGLGIPAKRLKCRATKPVLNFSCKTALLISGLTVFIKNLIKGRVAGECPNC